MTLWGASPARQDALNAGRLVTWGVVLVVAGIAAPALRSGKMTKGVSHAVHSADTEAQKTPMAAGLASVETRIKVFTTRSRMRAMRAELKLWTQRHGTPPTGSLSDLVGKNTAKDAWGHTVQYLAPTDSARGWLRSSGPNPNTDKDDVWLPLALSDLR